MSCSLCVQGNGTAEYRQQRKEERPALEGRARKFMKIFKLSREAGDVRAADALIKMMVDAPGVKVQSLKVMTLGDDYMGGLTQYFGGYAEKMLRELTEEDPGEGPIRTWQAEGTYLGAPAAFCGAVGYNMLGMDAGDAAEAHFEQWFTEEERKVVKELE